MFLLDNLVDEDFDANKFWLLNHSAPLSTVLEKLNHTYIGRRKQIIESTKENFSQVLEEWPRLLHSPETVILNIYLWLLFISLFLFFIVFID
jgi:hypothetical protein